MKIYFTIKFTIKKNTLDVHLVNFKAFVSSISEKYSDRFKTGNREKYLIMVKSFDLSKSFSYQSCFVSNYNSSFIELFSEDPSRTNNRVFLRWRDKIPYLISVKFC